MKRAQFCSLLLTFSPLPASAQIVADFVVNLDGQEFGRFSAQLDYLASPHATANFIRLAEGKIPWIDSSTGEVHQKPFYDGLTFHSATPGVEVATGSPSGDGNDGPGWIIRDDFSSQGAGAYTIYMENDGPNTNGSRFFINRPPTLNANLARRGGQYTVLGLVLQLNGVGGNGRLVVDAISNNPAGSHTIGSVKVRSSGQSTLEFRHGSELRNQPNHHSFFLLPYAREAVFSFRRNLGSIILDWDTTSGSALLLWSSRDLQDWIGPFSIVNTPGTAVFGYDLTPTVNQVPKAFFRGGVVEYPHWPSIERPLPDATIQTTFFDPNIGQVTTTYAFDQTGQAGIFLGAFGQGTFTATHLETAGPYRTEIELTPLPGSRQPTYRLNLHYDLDWSTSSPVTALPILANPSRVTGANVASPADGLIGGQWTYVPAP